MKIFFIVIVITIIIIMFSLNINLLLEYDILENSGVIKVKLFKVIPILFLNITIAGEYLNLSNKKNKVVKVKLDINDEKVKFFNDIGKNFLKRIYFNNIGIYALVCFENPLASSYIGGILNVLIGILYSKISIDYPSAKLEKNISTGFRQTELKVRLNADFIFSIFDIMFAVYKSFVNKIRRNNEKKSKLQQYR